MEVESEMRHHDLRHLKKTRKSTFSCKEVSWTCHTHRVSIFCKSFLQILGIDHEHLHGRTLVLEASSLYTKLLLLKTYNKLLGRESYYHGNRRGYLIGQRNEFPSFFFTVLLLCFFSYKKHVLKILLMDTNYCMHVAC